MSDPVAALPLGSRVVVRARLDASEGARAGGPTMTDAVGVLSERDERYVVVLTSRGPVRISRHLVVAAKEVPPKPSRRGAAHLAISVEDLQRVAAPSWGAVERERLGEWELRASYGFTQRGNSVVPVGEPGLPLADAVVRVEQWYAARGLPAKFAVAGPDGFSPEQDPLGALLLQRGYRTGSVTLTLTGSTATVAAEDPGGPPVLTQEELDAVWLDAYRGTRTVVPAAVESVLRGSPGVVFGSITPGGGLSQRLGLRPADAAGTRPVAVGRLGVAGGWAGLGAVWTDPAFRGRGLAAHLTARLAATALDKGIHLIHLHVEHDNEAALRLYRRLTFVTHSSYAYLTQPTPR